MKITKALLIRFSQGHCTPDEVDAIRNWLNDEGWPRDGLGEEVPGYIRKAVWAKLKGRIRGAAPRRGRVGRLGRTLAAAAAILIVVAGTYFFLRQQHSQGSGKSDSFITGIHEHKKVMLSDSSMVFLSPGSSIRVIQPFAKDVRKIKLTGQAIFEVARDATRPFTVVSGDISTTALGTSFKITSFPDKNETKVALSSGKIVVKDLSAQGAPKSLFLDPGEEAVYDKSTQTIHKTEAPDRQFDYRNNILYFKNADIREVVEKLSQYYRVKISFDALKQAKWSVSGEFDYQPLATVMQAIAYSCNISYAIRGDQVILKPNS